MKRPSDLEDDFIKREELATMRQRHKRAMHAMAEDERERLKQLHWMHCPKCGMELTEVPFRNVKVDNCFSCGGMYLDKGEIQKILAFKEPGWVEKMAKYLMGAPAEFEGGDEPK